MKVLFIASEIEGLVKTGGLADVARALPEALTKEGIEVRIVMPYYRKHVEAEADIDIPALDVSLSEHARFGVAVHCATEAGIPTYLIEHNLFFDRDGIYDDGYHAYEDNGIRYGLFSKAALNLCSALNWYPDIVHCNDWQTALVPYYLKRHLVGHRGFEKTKSVFTIHNGLFQGRIPNPQRMALGISESDYHSNCFEDHEMVNLVKGGIMYADAITTVSPGYREELLQKELSHGLWLTYRKRKSDFYGILNGCDYSQWNPETDSLISHRYSSNNMKGKSKCKARLQKLAGLPVTDKIPLFGLVSRLTRQKGLQYLIPALEHILTGQKREIQVVMLGSGDPIYVSQLEQLQARFPEQVQFTHGYNNSLAHQIEAGSDFFLMPSLFEPCGLNQIYSLKYGTLPIVRQTGGLGDTVVGLNPNQSNASKATGLMFGPADSQSCQKSIQTAMKLFTQKHDRYLAMQQTAMAADYSWKEPARKFADLYQSLC